MKIVFTGAQSTGKTTLLQALHKLPRFQNYEICDNLTRRAFAAVDEISLSETNRDLLIQNKIIELHLENIEKEDIIADRCFIDCYVYSMCQYLKGRIGDDMYQQTLGALKKHVGQYDYIFYVEPEFGLVTDGVRSNSIAEQEIVAHLFRGVIADLKGELNLRNIYQLTGDKATRVEQMKWILRGVIPQ